MVVRENLARDALRLIVWYPLRWLVEAISIRYGFTLFRIMGDIHYYIARRKRNVIAKNIRSAFGDRVDGKKILDITRKYFRNHYVNQLQIFLFPRFDRNNIERFHTFEGLDNLEDALKEEKGCILVHAHFGPAQLPLCALGLFGYPVMQLGLPTNEGLSYIGRKVAFRLRVKYESKIPARIISADSFLRPVFDWLKNNKVVMITGDGAGRGKFIGKFVPVQFFGKPTLFPVGAATFSQKTDSPLLPMFTIDLNSRYKTIIHKPITMQHLHKGDTTSVITAEFVKILEHYCSVFPYLWHFWDEWEDRLAE